MISILKRILLFAFIMLIVIVFIFQKGNKDSDTVFVKKEKTFSKKVNQKPKKQIYTQAFRGDIKMKKYFKILDSLLKKYEPLLSYPLDEFTFIHANSRIIDSLESFDYYRNIAKGTFISDQKELIIFHKGDSLLIPDSLMADSIQKNLKSNLIDLNIPEYKLRIIRNKDTLFTFPVRVGRNERKYLVLARNTVSLKTPTGKGLIVRIERNPRFINPVTGKTYYATKRDDNRYTKMPLIPWIEPELNGLRQGAMIHPTTNAETLGKAYSNGCVGLHEADMWRVYYEAPLGTRVVFRYDLKEGNVDEDSLKLEDIYHFRKTNKKKF